MWAWLKKLDAIFAAVTFAEAGEFETARDLLRGGDGEGKAGRRPTRERQRHLRPLPQQKRRFA